MSLHHTHLVLLLDGDNITMIANRLVVRVDWVVENLLVLNLPQPGRCRIVLELVRTVRRTTGGKLGERTCHRNNQSIFNIRLRVCFA